MAKRISKQELKSDDPFLERGRSIAHVLEKNWVFVLGAFVGVLVLGAAYVGYGQYQKYNELQAQESLHPWLNKIETQQETWEQSKALQEQNNEVADTNSNFDTEMSPLISELESEIKNHEGTLAAQSAAMKLAEVLERNEKKEQAANVLKDIESSVKTDSWLFGLFKMQLASLLSQVGSVDEALERLEKVTEVKSASFLHPEVYLKMGLLYEQKGNMQKAKDLYSQVSIDYADKEVGKSAQAYLHLLEIQQQMNPSEAGAAPEESSNKQ